MAESNRHAEILDRIINDLKGRIDERELFASHGHRRGEVLLTRNKEKNRIELEKPDLLIIRKDRALIIEIELGNPPKKIIGDAALIEFSDYFIWNSEWQALPEKKSLVIVIDEKTLKKGGLKKEQFDGLKECVLKKFKFELFDIVGSQEFMLPIDRWLDLHRSV